MTRRITILLLLIVGTLHSCGDRCKQLNGPRDRYEQLLTPVHVFELLTPAEVTLYKDTLAQNSLEIFAQPEVYHVFETDLIDTLCRLTMDACFRDQEAILINATFRRLDRIYFESAGEIVSGEMIEQDSIRVENTGLGDIDLTLKSEEVIAHIASSGNIILAGTAKRFVSLASRSGEIDAFNLLSDSTIVHTIGNGIIEVYADDYLEVNFLSPTTVRYRGFPDSIRVVGEGNLVNANF